MILINIIVQLFTSFKKTWKFDSILKMKITFLDLLY